MCLFIPTSGQVNISVLTEVKWPDVYGD